MQKIGWNMKLMKKLQLISVVKCVMKKILLTWSISSRPAPKKYRLSNSKDQATVDP